MNGYELFKAFTLIAEGMKGQAGWLKALQDGNFLIADYEQRIVLQPIFNAFAKEASAMSPFVISPLDDANGTLPPFRQKSPFLPPALREFNPNADFGNVTDRMAWIQQSMWPNWLNLVGNNPGACSGSAIRLVKLRLSLIGK